MIKTVVFDLDDTLIENSVHYNKTKNKFISLMEKLGFDPVKADLISGRKDRALLETKGFGYKRYLTALQETYKELALSKGFDIDEDIIKKIEKEVIKEFEGKVFLLENVLLTLNELKKDYKLILLTLGDEKIQESKIKRAGLKKYFDGIVIIEEKDTETFKTFLMVSKLSPNETVSVGNSLKHDILPAKANGVKAILYEHAEYLKFEKINYQLFPPDVPVIKNMYDCVNIIKQWAI